MQADKTYRFSLYRSLPLGHRDLDLQWQLQRLDDELVEAVVTLRNDTPDPVSFDCKLFPQGAAYQRMLILDAGGGTTPYAAVMIPRSATSANSPTWIRCEQIGSGLILNYQAPES